MAVTEEHRAQAKRPPAPTKLIDPTRYTSPEFARLELERLWSRTWQLACLDTDIPNPGDFYEYVIGDWSIVVVRAEDGGLRAYHNVCAHNHWGIFYFRKGCTNNDVRDNIFAFNDTDHGYDNGGGALGECAGAWTWTSVCDIALKARFRNPATNISATASG